MKTLPLLLAVGFAGASVSGDGELGSLAKATLWLNSPPLTAAGLRGKVVLVEFWTYTCINSLRIHPYVRAWADRYRAQGLVVIGVQAPEFGFEKDLDNVRRAVKELNVGYPVAVDNEMGIWRGFDNNYWPALYFVDAQGEIRHHQFGEGEYQESERVIQKLLTEAGATGMTRELVSVEGRGAEAAPDWSNLRSQENYLGNERTEGFGSTWILEGEWTRRPDAIALTRPHGKIVYRFHARDLHLVMGPAVRGHPVRFRVLIDGQPPGAAHGSDVDEQGYGTLDQQRMYQLIRQQKPIKDRRFEIEFLDGGAEAFAFTFG